MEARLHRAEGHAQGIGHLGIGQIEEEVEHEDRPLVRWQVPEPAFELVAKGERDLAVGHRRPVRLQRVHLDGPTSGLAPRHAVAGVDDESVQPGLEPLGYAKAPQADPCPDERVLDGVLGSLLAAQDQACDRIEATDAEHDQHRERVLVTVLRTGDEVPLQGTLRTWVRGRL